MRKQLIEFTPHSLFNVHINHVSVIASLSPLEFVFLQSEHDNYYYYSLVSKSNPKEEWPFNCFTCKYLHSHSHFHIQILQMHGLLVN